MSDVTITIPAERYERLTGLAKARGRTAEEQLAVLIDDACDGDPGKPEGLPLGVCEAED